MALETFFSYLFRYGNGTEKHLFRFDFIWFVPFHENRQRRLYFVFFFCRSSFWGKFVCSNWRRRVGWWRLFILSAAAVTISAPVDQLRVSTLISVSSFDVRLDQTVTLVTLSSLSELQKCVYTSSIQVTFSAQIALAGLHFRDSSRRETFVTDKRYKWPHLHMCHTLTRLMWARLS
jgi:hypothetical protein